jgi:hypothetical protein
MDLFGWILVGVIVGMFIGGGIYWAFFHNKAAYEIFGIEFRFRKNALWAQKNFTKFIVNNYLQLEFSKRGWMEHLSYFDDLEVVFDSKFPLTTNTGQLASGYYSEQFFHCVVGINPEKFVSPSGKVYPRMDRPSQTALVHELEHHFDFKHTGDADGDHNYTFLPDEEVNEAVADTDPDKEIVKVDD